MLARPQLVSSHADCLVIVSLKQELKPPVADRLLSELPPVTLKSRPQYAMRPWIVSSQHVTQRWRACLRRFKSTGFHMGDPSNLLMVWDFMRTFASHGLLRVRSSDCGLGFPFISHVREGKPQGKKDADASEAATVASADVAAALSLVLPKAATEDVLSAIRSSTWRGQRFMTQLHVALLRVLLGSLRGPCVKVLASGYAHAGGPGYLRGRGR